MKYYRLVIILLIIYLILQFPSTIVQCLMSSLAIFRSVSRTPVNI